MNAGRLELLELVRELEHEHLVHTGGGEQLEPALERREQVDVVAEDEPGMGVKGDHGRRQAGLDAERR